MAYQPVGHRIQCAFGVGLRQFIHQLRRRCEPYPFSLATGGNRQPRCQERFTRASLPEKNNWLAAAQVPALGQGPHLGRRKERRISERKDLQWLYLGEMGIGYPPAYPMLIAIFHFRS